MDKDSITSYKHILLLVDNTNLFPSLENRALPYS